MPYRMVNVDVGEVYVGEMEVEIEYDIEEEDALDYVHGNLTLASLYAGWPHDDEKEELIEEIKKELRSQASTYTEEKDNDST